MKAASPNPFFFLFGGRDKSAALTQQIQHPHHLIHLHFCFQSYMEDHLKNKDRLEQEWIALCAYEADSCATNLALKVCGKGKGWKGREGKTVNKREGDRELE